MIQRSLLTCPRFVAEARRVGTDPGLIFRCSANPALYCPKLKNQSSVKCLAHTNTHFGIRIGAFPAKTKWTHWFLRDSDEGAANVGLLSLSLWHPNTEHLPFNCLGAMISLHSRQRQRGDLMVSSSLSHWRANVSGRARQSKGRSWDSSWRHEYRHSKSARLSRPRFFKGEQNS